MGRGDFHRARGWCVYIAYVERRQSDRDGKTVAVGSISRIIVSGVSLREHEKQQQKKLTTAKSFSTIVRPLAACFFAFPRRSRLRPTPDNRQPAPSATIPYHITSAQLLFVITNNRRSSALPPAVPTPPPSTRSHARRSTSTPPHPQRCMPATAATNARANRRKRDRVPRKGGGA